MLRILFIFSLFFTAWPCVSMEESALLKSNKVEDFEYVKLNLSKKVQQFKYHIKDTIDYWEYLKSVFNPDNPANIKNYTRHLKKLNAYDRKICEESLTSLKNDKTLKEYPEDVFRAATMQNMIPHFDQKIASLTQASNLYTRMLEALYIEDKNVVFLAQLSQYILYFQSRYHKITSDPSPVFSAYANDYGSYEQQQIKNEITKNQLLLEFLQSLYPFVKNDQNIQKFLSYCPVLSAWLTNPSADSDLDAFCLDAIIMIFHKVIKTATNHEDNLSTQSEDILFMNKTQLPLLDISSALPISDPNFKKERTVWNSLYQARVEKFAPKTQPTLSPKIPSSSLKKESTSTITPSSQKTVSKNLSLQQNQDMHKEEADDSTLNSQSNETIEIAEQALDIDTVPQIVHDDISDLAPQLIDPLVDDLQEPLHKVETFKKSRTQNKLDKKQAKALAPKAVPPKSEPISLNKPTKKMLTNQDIIQLPKAHYGIVYDLLNNDLPPTVRYNDIISALEDKNIGITVEALGNGDYRKLHLPNGRKIFIYRPAVPQVGKRFLKTLREGLLEKWNLKTNNLRYQS